MNKTVVSGLTLTLVCGLALGAVAKTSSTHKAGGHTMTLTGCLQKGNEPNTFMLTNVAGKSGANQQWELIGAPADLKMSDHVGHKVTVTGMTVSTAEAKKIEGEKSAKEEAKEKHLKVTSLKHVAPSCP